MQHRRGRPSYPVSLPPQTAPRIYCTVFTTFSCAQRSPASAPTLAPNTEGLNGPAGFICSSECVSPDGHVGCLQWQQAQAGSGSPAARAIKAGTGRLSLHSELRQLLGEEGRQAGTFQSAVRCKLASQHESFQSCEIGQEKQPLGTQPGHIPEQDPRG